jgi:hypothetical protein
MNSDAMVNEYAPKACKKTRRMRAQAAQVRLPIEGYTVTIRDYHNAQ